MLAEGNLLAAKAAYCAYGASAPRNGFPASTNVDFINSAFSTMFYNKCGSSRYIANHNEGVNANDPMGNYVYETGEPIS